MGSRMGRVIDAATFAFGLMLVLSMTRLVATLDHSVFRVLAGVLAVLVAVALWLVLLVRAGRRQERAGDDT